MNEKNRIRNQVNLDLVCMIFEHINIVYMMFYQMLYGKHD